MDMTFIVPDLDGRSTGMAPAFPGVETFWRGWTAGFQTGDMARTAIAANLRVYGATLDLMLLPLAALSGGAPAARATGLMTTPPDVAAAVVAPPVLPAIEPDDVTGMAPALLAQPEGKPDDLLLIKGIGPKLKHLLNSLGVWHFRQIVGWTPAEVSWVNAKIDFRGRIQRERWQSQAAELMKAMKTA
jgi:predicted flap endonuclease-1-like 5' DNA nuclease